MSGALFLPPALEAHPLISDWIAFGPDGVVDVLSGRVELGQGISTALAQIAADELDVDIAAIRLTQGHTGVSPAEGPTVGSLSVTLGGQAVRLAASAARALMLRRAAGLLQTVPDSLTVEEGRILLHDADTGLRYATLTESVDLAVPIAATANPKLPSERRLSGTSVPRVDGSRRLGPDHFIHDIEREGMLHGRVLLPPDPDAALGATKGLVTARGTELIRKGRFLAVMSADEYLAVREAERLAPLIPWQPGADQTAHPVEALAGAVTPTELILDDGWDTVDASREITLSITKPVLCHGSIGPSCAVAWQEAGRFTVLSHSQNVFALRAAIAAVLRLPSADIEVIHLPGAGCYGHTSADDVALDAALMSRAAGGRPVRVLATRAQEFRNAPLSPAMSTRVSARLDPAGQMIAYAAHVISPPHSTRPVGAEAPNLRAAQYLPDATPLDAGNDPPQPQGGSDRNAVPGYAVGAVRLTRARPMVVGYRPSAMRGLGAYTNIIALEALMNECAEAAGMHPIAYRIMHLEDQRATHVIETVRDMAGPWQPTEGVGYGIGYARYKNSAGYLATIARVAVDVAVRVTDVWTAFDVGEAINPGGAQQQVEGGIVQAISWTLKEEVQFANGQNLTQGWEDYPILTFSEQPRLHTQLIARPEAPPLGAGEISVGPAGAAVVGAVRAALGVTPQRLPLTRHALVSLLS